VENNILEVTMSLQLAPAHSQSSLTFLNLFVKKLTRDHQSGAFKKDAAQRAVLGLQV
jgi:hypothetical protein